MATQESYVGQPPQADNRAESAGQVSGHSLAKAVAENHRRGLSRRQKRDLTAEKYLMHIDGEGDAQWADVFHGSRVSIPKMPAGSVRIQHNLLRPLTDNMVAYHTTSQFRFVADAKQDRDSRESAMIDQAFANYVSTRQRLNAIFAGGMYLAAAHGHCPVHASWRDDIASDPYEPIYGTNDELQALLQQLAQQSGQPMALPSRGFIDCWVGDPWDSVYHVGARRDSVQSWSYGRTLPADLVRRAFDHVPEARTLEGSTAMPSASRFQRIGQKWASTGREVHGSAFVQSGQQMQEEELIALVCREIAAGIDPQYPDGRLIIVGLRGAASTDRGEGDAGRGSPLLLHDSALPGKKFSAVRVYSGARFDDVLGKPYVGDLDDLQVHLNQLLSLRMEYARRASRPPFLNTGAVDADTAAFQEDGFLDLDPSQMLKNGSVHPQFLQLPDRHLATINQAIEDTMSAMFRIGGWQAASRGESTAGDPAAKVVALAQADDTIHGPTNQRFRETVEDYMGLCWSLMKQYADVPWLIDVTGDELAHLAEPYIDRTKLSDTEPVFKLVSGFGATTEAKAQQLMQLVGAVGADGEPLMRTRTFRKAWPDQSIYPDEQDPEDYRLRRPKTINAKMRQYAVNYVEQLTEQMGQDPLQGMPMNHPVVVQIAQMLNQALTFEFPVLMDDDINAHLEWLSTLTQDETEHALVRQLAVQRQSIYFEWLAQQQAAVAASEAEQVGAEAEQKEAGKARGTPQTDLDLTGGTATSESMKLADKSVADLTAQAKGM